MWSDRLASSARALILSAPSGTGKTTLAKRLVEAIPGARLSISVTTRPPRGAERQGSDYHFVDGGRFDEMVAGGELAEWALVHSHRYGTPWKALEEPGEWVVLDIDVQGGMAIKRQSSKAVTVFLLPPTWRELEARLRGRQTDSEWAIEQRLAAAQAEIGSGLGSYDYVVVNRQLDEALEDLKAITRAEASRRPDERDELRRRFGLAPRR
jgi:guanylate kinase